MICDNSYVLIGAVVCVVLSIAFLLSGVEQRMHASDKLRRAEAKERDAEEALRALSAVRFPPKRVERVEKSGEH